jgi:ComF family protein
MLCAACDEGLPRIAHSCPRCALPLADSRSACGRCLAKRRPAVDAAVAVFEYRFPLDRLVQRFKFAGDLAIGRYLGEALACRVAALERPQVIAVPPLSAQRLRERGFHQALELARTVQRATAIACDARLITRLRETPSQHALDRRERLANLRGAFACRHALAGAHVAIVDDVITTGATAQTLARVLKESGASRVSVWAVARTPDPALG